MRDEPQSLTLAGGRLAALAWGDPEAPTWLALHGWLDNAASFSRLAPRLVAARHIRLVALDLPGHGVSAPRPEGTDYALWDNCHAVLDALDELGLAAAPLLGHSMGAGVACLVAAAVPERVERLMLIDGIGSLTTPAEEAAQQLRKGLLGHRRPSSPSPRYPDAATALAARVAGGVTPIDAATAEPLVARNLEPTADGRVRLRTDGRLLRPSLVRLSPEQSRAMLNSIEAPTLLVEGEAGILGRRAHAEQARQALRGLERRVLPGGHHLHLEPDAVAAVAAAILAWWATPDESQRVQEAP